MTELLMFPFPNYLGFYTISIVETPNKWESSEKVGSFR